MRAHNTKISSSRYGCRLPFETPGVGNGYAGSGPVTVYHLDPEEIMRRYGPAKQADWSRPVVVPAGTPKKGDGQMAAFEVYQPKRKPKEDKKLENESVNKAKVAMNIHDLIEARDELYAEMECLRTIQHDAGIAVSPGVEKLLNRHQDVCQNRLKWIEKVFSETHIEVPSDPA